MTPFCARPRFRLARTAALLGAVTLGASLPLSVLAQDNNSGDCVANDNSGNETCAAAADYDADSISAQPSYPLDWTPVEAVPPALRNRQCENCEGRYIDPLAAENKDIPPEQSRIRARANSTQLQNREVTLSGGADAIQGYRRMHADEVVVDRIDETVVLKGNVTLREPGVLMVGDSAKIDTRSGEAFMTEGEFVFHREHVHGSADLLQRDSDGLIHIHNGNFSYCAPGADDWAIRADKMELDLVEGIATARGARVEIENVPVFYTPWLRFPLDDRRHTGFLWPDFGNNSTGGLDITTPFYFNLAPNYDALYAPRYIQERGLNHELQLRYLNPLLGNWTVGGAYMTKDDRYENQVPAQDSTDRWLAVVRQNALFNQRWRSHIDYSKASDVDYLKDLDTSNLDSQRRTSLLQLASLDYLGDRWIVDLQVQQFESLADDISNDYKKLPQFTASYRGTGQPSVLEPVLVAQYSNFDTDDDRVTGERLYGEAGLTYPMLQPYGFLTPTLKYRYLDYKLSNLTTTNNNHPSSGSAVASLDGGLFFERSTQVAGKFLTQTLEPRVYYLYSEYEDQTDQPDFDSAELTFTYNQLFRDTRFSGRDRIDDANQVSVGITSHFIDNETGRSLLKASIGQIFYFRDREVRLGAAAQPLDDSGSEIAADLNFTPNEQFGFRTSLVWDPYSGNMNSGHMLSSYQSDHGALYNLGYAYRRPTTGIFSNQPPTEEISASSYLPLNNRWSVFAGVSYSLEADESVEDMFGVEYDTCCWTVRLLHLRYFNNVSGQLTPNFSDPDLERENTTQFQIILKGMGGYGDRITQIMEDMIRGFKERDY